MDNAKPEIPMNEAEVEATPQEPTAFNPNPLKYVDLGPGIDKPVGVAPTAPATKQDLDEMRDAVKELTKIMGEALPTLNDILKRIKAGRF